MITAPFTRSTGTGSTVACTDTISAVALTEATAAATGLVACASSLRPWARGWRSIGYWSELIIHEGMRAPNGARDLGGRDRILAASTSKLRMLHR